MYSRNGTLINEARLNEQASLHAKSVEALCWSPKLQMTDEEYQNLTAAKTHELCQALMKQYNTNKFPLVMSGQTSMSNIQFQPPPSPITSRPIVNSFSLPSSYPFTPINDNNESSSSFSFGKGTLIDTEIEVSSSNGIKSESMIIGAYEEDDFSIGVFWNGNQNH